MPLPTMKTPAEFIDHYFKLLQKDFNNIKLSKTGFMGFMLNIMGNIQFDNKNYYDSLFLESFPALAQDNNNLQLHAGLHGFDVPFATASSITSGLLKLNLEYLPTHRPNLKSRTISFGSSPSSTSGATHTREAPIVIDSSKGISYTVDTSYFLNSKSVGGNIISYYAEAVFRSGLRNIAVQVSNPTLPILDAFQYVSNTTIVVLPFYPIGSYYNIDIQLAPSDMPSNITAVVSNSQAGTSSTFNIVANKNAYSPTSQVMFYTILPNNLLRIECGSGIKGIHIPESSTVEVTVNITRGALGNISPPGTAGVISSQHAISATVVDTYLDGSIQTATVELSKLITPVIDNSSGGLDTLQGSTLRDAIIRYIQTRDNLISFTDYNNILASTFKHYSVIFNKSKISNNTIDLNIPLFSQLGEMYLTQTLNVRKVDFEASAFKINAESTVYELMIIDSTGDNYTSPFYYRFDPLFKAYLGNILHQNKSLNYTNVNNLSTSIAPPYIYVNMKYTHSLISPYTIMSIRSYEDISPYITNGSISIEYVSQGVVTNSTQPFRITPINQHSGIQSTLSQILNIGDTVMNVVSTVSFPIVGSVIVDNETIQYTIKDDTLNTLGGLVRGVGSTTDVTTQDSTHNQSAIVFDVTVNNTQIDFIFGQIASQLSSSILSTDVTIPILDTSQFPLTGTVVIGTEQVSYTGKIANALTGCTRGANTTIAVIHTVNDIIYELVTSTTPSTDQLLGCLTSPTQMIITMTRAIIDPFGVSADHIHSYSFSVNQLTDIREYLFVKQYSMIGVSGSVNGTVTPISISIPAVSTSSFPTSGLIRIDNEEIEYLTTTATTFNGLTRSANNTVASSHLAGVPIIQLTQYELSIPLISDLAYTAEPVRIREQIDAAYSAVNLPLSRSIGDEVQLKFLNTSTLPLKYLQASVSNGGLYNAGNAINGLLFPLNVTVSLLLNISIITTLAANVFADINSLKLTIADALVNKYTATQIRISDADIILLAKTIQYVDDANVTFTDSSTTPVPVINNEINVLTTDTILPKLTKMDRLEYNPVLWHWNINNITVTYTIA